MKIQRAAINSFIAYKQQSDWVEDPFDDIPPTENRNFTDEETDEWERMKLVYLGPYGPKDIKDYFENWR